VVQDVGLHARRDIDRATSCGGECRRYHRSHAGHVARPPDRVCGPMNLAVSLIVGRLAVGIIVGSTEIGRGA
jgi:hypothetical protein